MKISSNIIEAFSIYVTIRKFLKATKYKVIKPNLKRLFGTYYQVFGNQTLTPHLIDTLTDLVYIVKALGGIQRVKDILQEMAEKEAQK